MNKTVIFTGTRRKQWSCKSLSCDLTPRNQTTQQSHKQTLKQAKQFTNLNHLAWEKEQLVPKKTWKIQSHKSEKKNEKLIKIIMETLIVITIIKK